MPVPVGTSHMAGPSAFDKWKMGAMMGSSVGLIIGFIFGATNIIRYGPGANGMLRTLGQYMLTSSATFGFFMSIGSTIRADGQSTTQAIRFQRALHGQSPMIHERHARTQRIDVQKS